MKQRLKDILYATKNRQELERLRAAIKNSSDLVDPKRTSLRVENYRYRNRRDLLQEILGEEFHPFGDFRNSKIGWREVISELAVPGLELPTLCGTFNSINDIDPTVLPDNFVIKPDAGLASLGVLALKKIDDTRYLNLFTGLEKEWSEFVEDFEATRAKNKLRLSTTLLVEELLSDPTHPDRLPSDWKFFVGGGKVFLTCRVARYPSPNEKGYENRFGFWDADLKPHPQLHQNRIQDDSASLPKNIRELIKIAEMIATSFAQPVCRIDLYNLPGRIVFGEYTPNPGGHYAADKDQDERLGTIWLEAETRYNAMLIRKVQELGHPKYGLEIWKP